MSEANRPRLATTSEPLPAAVRYEATTKYGVHICASLPTLGEVRRWRRFGGLTFPGCKLVRHGPNGSRVIWTHKPEEAAA